MERSRSTSNWSTCWFVDDLGYQVLLLNRCRVVRRLEGDGSRDDAIEKAVELALQYRVPLTEVGEAAYRDSPDGAPR